MSAGVPRVLSIAGTDPTGGAGVQADLKSIAANGGYGMAAVTALVAQNTRGVRSVHRPPTSFLAEQLHAVSDDVAIDAVKIGMLADVGVIATVRQWLSAVRPPVVVLDPVMVSTSGHRLLDPGAEDALRLLLPVADLVTPNVPELAILLACEPASDGDAVVAQARELARRHGVRVLAKGGHLEGSDLRDALVEPDGRVSDFRSPRIETRNTHGTGCSLSSAIATRRAAGSTWSDATDLALRWLSESIRHGSELAVGGGHGPVSHFAGLWARGGLDTAPTPGEIADEWWQDTADVREAIDGLDFIRSLGEGTLDREAFAWYLAQDAVYLREYSRVLAQASRLAPSAEEQTFWITGAHAAVATELTLHEQWLDLGGGSRVQASPTTTAYLDHLGAAADSGDYERLIAAVLPCYWLYHDVGSRLHPLSGDAHPYRDWLDTYAAPEFADATLTAIEIVTAAAARAAPRRRAVMAEAFRASATHELSFWRAPLDAVAVR
ncbi:bifunctional hydroxymethylpyrimidine kinase/phosphomethylpyrimidine kinase [Microbacterium sp. A1-JK]|uniref:bifunctional hydroxymethylpyrimidine kinase/phosphomethylpyrimidine kinase n=1 Tax=Microbacterium sp. A1-JK TaxID=3177516 RepID=UPI003887EC19